MSLVEVRRDGRPRASNVAYSTTPFVELALAFARRVAAPPPGDAVLRWAAVWATYLALVVMLVGVAQVHPAPAVGTWLFVLAVETSQPIEPERRGAYIAWILMLLLVPALVIATLYPDVGHRAWNAALVLLAASVLDRRPLARGVFVAGALATWAAWLLATVVAWLILTNAGLRMLHSALAALDPRAHMIVTVIVQAMAGAVTVSAMLYVLWVHRWWKGGGR
jgi:hypothetical protein